MLYYSYGSNMSIKRLQSRVPSARVVTVATLHEHDLRFHKKGMDGSAKCDAYETRIKEHSVIGIVFEIAASEKPVLDKKEGLGHGYEEKTIQLFAQSGEIITASTYYATNINSSLQPFFWYKHHVLTGAKENEFPAYYVEKISNIKSIPDQKHERHEHEMAIYDNKYFNEDRLCR